jgi:hypothetical protein
MTAGTTTARAAVEATLADRAMVEPDFLEKVILDPNGTVKPILAETVEDDGEMDLSDVNISVHIETDRNLHFVITLSEEGDEVSGFAVRGTDGLASALRTFEVAFTPTLTASKDDYTSGSFCTHSAVCVCASDDCD